ncbi:MAG: hypothetical protein WCW35_05435 [Bacteroidota bacterium]
MLRFIVWMIIVFFAAKILGLAIRTIRKMLTPNRDIARKETASPYTPDTTIEDIPYEEIKDAK